MTLRTLGRDRLAGALGVRRLSLCVGLLLASSAIGRESPASSPPTVSGQPLAPFTSAEIKGCPVLPADNIWNAAVDTMPVVPNSDLYVDTIGADVGLHPDFGAGLLEGTSSPIGIPFVDVPASQPGVEVTFEYADESDPGPYPIPTDAPIEGGPDGDGDRHVLVLERDNCKLYELFDAHPQDDGSWKAVGGAIYDLNSHDLRPDGWTSADAAGLPVLPGLVRYEEVAAGEILHALRFTVPATRRAYVWPARHRASTRTEERFPPMGQRFRLKADFDMSGFSPQVRVILRALQKYGMMLADNGSPWYLSGAPDDRWDNDVLRELRGVKGADFEAVDVSSLQLNPDSGQVRTTSATATRGPTNTRTPSTIPPTPSVPPTPTIPRTPDDSPLYLPLVYNGLALAPPAATRTTQPATPVPPTRTSQPATPVQTTQPPTPTRTVPPATPPRTTPPATPTLAVVSADLFVDDDNTTGAADGSVRRPYRTVQQAIDAASGGNVIAVAGGTYIEAVLVQNKTVSLYGGYIGGTEADYTGGTGGNFGVRNPTANVANLQGNLQDSVVTLLESGSTVVDGFRITRGVRSTIPLPGCVGGGLYVLGGEPSISNNIIENNSTCADAANGEDLLGGGIYASNANISIQGNVIRDNVSGRGAAIAIAGGEVVIRGNTIQDNIGRGDHGGGVYVFSPNAQISHNLIAGNEIGRELGYGWGGGMAIFNEGGFFRLSYNVFTDNFAPSLGSAILVDNGARAEMDHELFYANQCGVSSGVPGGVSTVFVDGDAGGMGSSLTMSNSTIAGHDCDPPVAGTAVTVLEFSDVTIRNSIFWGNGGDDVEVDETSKINIRYTLSEELLSGMGNLSTDPLFANLAGNDFHVRSSAGRWDPAANGGAGGWVLDNQDSPAIDAADPASPFAAEPEPNGGRANMGVYGDTPQASKSAPR